MGMDLSLCMARCIVKEKSICINFVRYHILWNIRAPRWERQRMSVVGSAPIADDRSKAHPEGKSPRNCFLWPTENRTNAHLRWKWPTTREKTNTKRWWSSHHSYFGPTQTCCRCIQMPRCIRNKWNSFMKLAPGPSKWLPFLCHALPTTALDTTNPIRMGPSDRTSDRDGWHEKVRAYMHSGGLLLLFFLFLVVLFFFCITNIINVNVSSGFEKWRDGAANMVRRTRVYTTQRPSTWPTKDRSESMETGRRKPKEQ